MGQSTSQPQEEAGYDPKDANTLLQDEVEDQNHHPTSENASDDDDVVFSSQVHSAVVPALPPSRRPAKIKYSSSRQHSSQAPTPIARHKMSVSSLFQSSPAFASSMKPGVPVNEDEFLPPQPKKKKRSKKRRNSSSTHDKDQLSSVPHTSSSLYPDLPAFANEQQQQLQQQSAARSVSEAIQEPSAFAEIWESQEQAIAAKREHIEEDEPVESQNAVSKRKRKRNSHNKAGDAHEQGSKKRKKSHSSATGGIAAEHDELARSNADAEHQASHVDGDVSLNDLAAQLYTNSRINSHSNAISEDSTSALDIGLDHENPSEVMGIDGQIQGDLTGCESMQHEATDGAEVYQNGHIDEQSGVANYGVQIDAGMSSDIVPSHTASTAYDFVEIPSSVPHPNGTGEHSAKPRATNKTSTGRKRVAKPDFFSRIVDEIDERLALQSPSTAALSRRERKGKGREVTASEGNVQVRPPTSNGKVKQPKITSMMDGNIPATPSTQSVVRSRTPKTPATLSGAFSEFEIRNLTQAIERYRDDNEMTQHQVNELLHSNPKEAKAGDLWEHVVATCPGRSRQKVINQTRRKFHNFVARGTWTPEQDAELGQMYRQYGNKYALIGQLINRHPEDIRDRIRNYTVCGDSLKKDQWTQGEVEKLLIIIEDASTEIRKERAKRGVDDDRPVEEDINWQLVSEGMGRTRSRIQCMAKWKSIKPQLTGGGLDGETMPIEEIIQQAREIAMTMSYRNRSIIIKEILKTGANADSRIPWLKVRNELGNQWTRPPLMIVWFRLKRTIAGWQSLNVKEICTFLLQHFQQTHKLEYPTEESGEIDYDVEYREVEYRIRRGRNNTLTPKSAAFISKASDDEEDDEEEEQGEEEAEEHGEGEAEGRIRDLLDATGEKAAEAETSRVARRHSVDLGIGSTGENERVVEDSEPETNARNRPRLRRHTRSGGSRSKPRDIQRDELDDSQSSDTNASQVSSIPAR
ncbi:hypothetical protein F5X97DRAFT_306235 [Nemania serpens]|nr:hypothetical protein F5X97DRAFT_306235 [Nemania serpens]